MLIMHRPTLPPPPDGDLHRLTDVERKIDGGAVYVLQDVQEYVRQLGVGAFNFATDQATSSFFHELRWEIRDLYGFFLALGRYRYLGSQWCYGSGTPKIAFPADVYLMGYDRFKQVENQRREPYTYFKFGFSEKSGTIEIFSIHPDRDAE